MLRAAYQPSGEPGKNFLCFVLKKDNTTVEVYAWYLCTEVLVVTGGRIRHKIWPLQRLSLLILHWCGSFTATGERS